MGKISPFATNNDDMKHKNFDTDRPQADNVKREIEQMKRERDEARLERDHALQENAKLRAHVTLAEDTICQMNAELAEWENGERRAFTPTEVAARAANDCELVEKQRAEKNAVLRVAHGANFPFLPQQWGTPNLN